jgi:hypothetical protein
MEQNEWICLKEIPEQFILGKIYEGRLGKYTVYGEDIITFTTENNNTRSFYFTTPIFKWLKLSDYFGKLADWRNKQIDQILEHE